MNFFLARKIHVVKRTSLKKKSIYLAVLVPGCSHIGSSIFCGMQILSYSLWDLVS